jgi:hypothetical protein
VTTSLALVLITTVVFGSSMPLFTRCVLGKDERVSQKDLDEVINDLNEEDDEPIA